MGTAIAVGTNPGHNADWGGANGAIGPWPTSTADRASLLTVGADTAATTAVVANGGCARVGLG